jgi:hypothetical protein
MPDINKDRANWVASLAIAYTATMTDAKRLELLGLFYDTAHAEGKMAGIDRMAQRLTPYDGHPYHSEQVR